MRIPAPGVAALKGTTERTRTDTAGLAQTYVADRAHVWIIEDGEWKIPVEEETAEFRQ